MEEPGGNLFEVIKNPVRRKRSHTFRRSQSETQQAQETNGLSSLSTTPTSDDASKVSSDDTMGAEDDSRSKESNLNPCHSRLASTSVTEVGKYSRRSKKEDVSLEVIYGNTTSFRDSNESLHSNTTSSEAVLSTADRKTSSKTEENAESPKFMESNNSKRIRENSSSEPSGASDEGLRNGGKVKKVKLKVGGVTRMIEGNDNSSKTSQSTEPDKQRRRLMQKDGPDYESSLTDKRIRLKGIPWKDFSSGGFALGKEDALARGSLSKNQSEKQGQEQSDPACKSRRPQKKPQKQRVLDDTSDGEDDEIRYLEKLKNSRSSGARGNHEEPGKKRRRLSKLSGEPVNENGRLQSGKEGKQNVRRGDTDDDEEDEALIDAETESGSKNKSQKESTDSSGETNKEVTLTSRQRALRNKDASAPGSSAVDFPNGLPPVPSRKQNKLTDVELQLKKAEAAQRRKLQNEKAARESEAEAIRKILGQDSNRKKREEKNKKRKEELAQEKAANVHASNTVRWIMGPNGTTVVFPEEIGLPCVFDKKPSCYPPPREKCAGPSCKNPYKYRDSRSKLPLCSLGCYKAVQARDQTSVELGSAGDAVSAH